MLYIKAGSSYAYAQDCIKTLLLPKATRCVCLSATSDGAFCPIPLKHASLVPFILTNAIVDASSDWTKPELHSLLACFKNLYFFNQQGTAFQDSLGSLVGRVAITQPQLICGPSAVAAPQPVVTYSREQSPELAFAELPQDFLDEQERRVQTFREN